MSNKPFEGRSVPPGAKPQRRRPPGSPHVPRKPKPGAIRFTSLFIDIPSQDKISYKPFWSVTALMVGGILAGAFWPDLSKKKAPEDDKFVMEMPPPPPAPPPPPPEPPPPPPKVKPPPTQPPAPKQFGLQKEELAEKTDMAVATGNTVNKKADSIVAPAPPALPVAINQPALRGAINAEFPAKAREREQSGTVVLQVTIDTLGRVTKAEIKKSAGTDFDRSATKAVYGAMFTPPLVGGRHISGTFAMTIEFDFQALGGGE